MYELALESCEKSGDVELGLEFFDVRRASHVFPDTPSERINENTTQV